MAKTLDVETNLFSTEHPHISKHTSISSILLSLVIALAGIACVVLSLNLEESSSTGSMALLTVGTIFVLYALYRFFWKSAEIVYIPTGSAIVEGSCYVDSADLPKLQKMVETKCFERNDISFKHSGNGRMDYRVSKDGKFVAVQLFQFVPYTYEPASEVFYYTDDNAKAFQSFLKLYAK